MVYILPFVSYLAGYKKRLRSYARRNRCEFSFQKLGLYASSTASNRKNLHEPQVKSTKRRIASILICVLDQTEKKAVNDKIFNIDMTRIIQYICLRI